MSKETEKVRRWRERMKVEGKQAVTLWLNRGALERLNTLAHEAKITASEFIERAVTDTTAKVTDTVTVTQPKVTDTVTDTTAMVTDTVTDTVTDMVTDTVAVIREIVREEVERALYQAAKRGVTVTQSKVTDTVTDTTAMVTDTVTDTTRKGKALSAEELARSAQSLHKQGLSYAQIADQWEKEKVPTLQGGKRWHKGTIHGLVQRYCQ
jgi:hypothetical protein